MILIQIAISKLLVKSSFASDARSACVGHYDLGHHYCVARSSRTCLNAPIATRPHCVQFVPLLLLIRFVLFTFFLPVLATRIDLSSLVRVSIRVMPSLRIRHFGKTMTTEKAALTNSLLYFKKGKRLVLPVLVSIAWTTRHHVH